MLSIADQVHPLNAMTYPFDSRPLSCRIVTWLLDAIASLFSLPVPDKVNQEVVVAILFHMLSHTLLTQTPDPLDLDDSMVDSLVEGPEALAWDDALRAYTTDLFVPTHKITPTLLAKYVKHSERENMTFVRKHTNIPVPQPRYPHLSSWLVMDLVKGRMLVDCWDTLSALMKFRVACTMRMYVSQLQRLRGTVPGSVAGGIVGGVLFDHEYRGPFQTVTQFRHYYEMVSQSGWVSLVRARKSVGSVHVPSRPSVIGLEWPLVFTHGDLNLGNIMLSDDGVLWIIDWETSGFFPPWLETVGLRYYDNAPKSWQHFRWFVAGSYPDYEQLWDFFMDEVHRYPSLKLT
jgi:Phosphotransferase enzyme family